MIERELERGYSHTHTHTKQRERVSVAERDDIKKDKDDRKGRRRSGLEN